MTIAGTDKAGRDLIKEHHVYGAETVVNALVRATTDELYLGEDVLIRLIHKAYEREEARYAVDSNTGRSVSSAPRI